MKIGIDISQLVYRNTGVARYLGLLLENLITEDTQNKYILFVSTLRGNPNSFLENFSRQKNVDVKRYYFPPLFLDFLWNKLHMIPIECFIGNIDVFISSDWIQPPTKAKKVTILYDLIVYKFPKEMDKKITSTQKRRLFWVKREVDKIICISDSTKKDAQEILDIPANRLKVIYPGGSL